LQFPISDFRIQFEEFRFPNQTVKYQVSDRNSNIILKYHSKLAMAKTFSCICFVLIMVTGLKPSSAMQTDRVEVIKGAGRSVSGKITRVDPFGVTIQAVDGTKEYATAQIAKLVFQGQPLEIERARTQINGGRFDGAIEELEKITEAPKREEVKQEIEFIKALASAQIAFQSGPVTPQDAGRMLNDFVRKYPDSLHLYPATEMLGRLFTAVGKFDLAESEFAKLNDSKWPELVLKGNFLRGETLVEQGKFAEALAAYDAILKSTANDDLTQTYKLLSKIRIAKTNALAGNDGESVKTLEEIIRVENAENALVFSYAYNSLGSVYLKQNKLKESMMAFLHTSLLYTTERDNHAEALYHLAQIWPQLDQLDRANDSRQILKTRYRNSVWALRLQ
jgi:tetratricopeptide (TPR) repeat protein